MGILIRIVSGIKSNFSTLRCTSNYKFIIIETLKKRYDLSIKILTHVVECVTLMADDCFNHSDLLGSFIYQLFRLCSLDFGKKVIRGQIKWKEGKLTVEERFALILEEIPKIDPETADRYNKLIRIIRGRGRSLHRSPLFW